MDAKGRKLLEAFDAPHGVAAAGNVLALDAVSQPEELRPLAEELVARGWLRRAEKPDTYTRTEDGRLAIAGSLDVTLYTRPGCHLCEEAKAQIIPLLRRSGATLHEINIDADAILRERYNVDVPVIFIGARKVAKHRVDREQFKRQFEEASRNQEQ